MPSKKISLPIVQPFEILGGHDHERVASKTSGGRSDLSSKEQSFGRYWRSIEQYRNDPEVEQFLEREFPLAASQYPEGVSRRRWIQMMGASLALASSAVGCRYPEEVLLPFVVRPEGRVPGQPYYRATNFELAGRVYNLLISCVDGRPLKIEPNELHPSGGGTDVFSQASILTLYDPDRARAPRHHVDLEGRIRRETAAWEVFDNFARQWIDELAERNAGESSAVLMPPTQSPSVVRMLKLLRKRLPAASVCRYESVDTLATREATTKLFGVSAREVLSLEDAEVIVSVQADFLGMDQGMIHNASTFSKKRDPFEGDMSRLYVVEGGYTLTGASADSRLALRPSQMHAFLAELERRIDALVNSSVEGEQPRINFPFDPASDAPFDELSPPERTERFLNVLAYDIAAAGEKAVVVVGDALGAEAVAAGIQLNHKLGSLGHLQKFLKHVDADLGELISLNDLTESIATQRIDSLLILGGNPVFTAPADVDLRAAIRSVEHSVYLGEYDDETADLCEWSLPMSHPLESWGDCVGDEGYYGVCQPHILPLLGGRSTIELLHFLAGEPPLPAIEIVRQTAQQLTPTLTTKQWVMLLHDGFRVDMRVDFLTQTPPGAIAASLPSPVSPIEADRNDLEIIFTPADGIYDGRFANNGWLQELPQALTKMAWDNAAIMSPRTARALHVKHGLFVALRSGDATVELPVYEMPGCAPGVVSVPIGYGRYRAGTIGGSTEYDVPVVGIDVYPLRRNGQMLIAFGVEGRPRYDEYDIATTQNHWAIDELGRTETTQRSFQLVREGTLALLEQTPEFAELKGPHVPDVGYTGSLWREPINEIEEEFPDLPQWGMAIDMTKCIGCNACVIACQSENNVPIVGREQVLLSREMHWLRIDRYFQGDEDNADVVHQPMACVHCELAPCESVCPVAATVHTPEGLNAMVYNRCIGTRYCANNCPFKVRRFNYFNYNEKVGVGYGWDAYPEDIHEAERRLQSLVLNPEVTVRGRGVMEKCTYCVQRIQTAKIEARITNRGIVEDGSVVTACQSACPTNAIVFGNLSDPNSQVSKQHRDVRSYSMLEQLNIKPRTEYLARVRNTPLPLMTSVQRIDLAVLGHPDRSASDAAH